VAAFKEAISPAAVKQLGAVVRGVLPSFPVGRFVALATKDLEGLELTGRVDHVANALVDTMPTDFSQAAVAVSEMASSKRLTGWVSLAVNNYVAKAGIDHPDVALPLLALLTPLFSSEFAIRSFLERHPKESLEQLSRWCSSPDEHVRRLVSEGTRPRLPWAPVLRSFIADPSPTIELRGRSLTMSSTIKG
jgi:hypothetical protein